MMSEILKKVIWFRYVDDVFCVSDENFDFEDLLLTINGLCESINFTIEYESEEKLAFLDVLVKRSESGKPEFSVFRKDTHVDNYLHAFSDTDDSVKIGVIAGMYLRALRICSPINLNNEFAYIKNIFKNLGYSESFISKGLYKARKSFYRVNDGERKKYENVLVVPKNDICNLNEIPKEIKLVSRRGISIGKLVKVKNNQNANDNSGIYAIPCTACEKVYVGESDNFKRRMREHGYSKRDGDMNSALVVHESEKPGHIVNIHESELFYPINNVEIRKVLEQFIIAQNATFNLSSASEKIDDIVVSYLNKTKCGVSILSSFVNLKDKWKGRSFDVG